MISQFLALPVQGGTVAVASLPKALAVAVLLSFLGTLFNNNSIGKEKQSVLKKYLCRKLLLERVFPLSYFHESGIVKRESDINDRIYHKHYAEFMKQH